MVEINNAGEREEGFVKVQTTETAPAQSFIL